LFKNKFTAPIPFAKGNAKGESEIYNYDIWKIIEEKND